MQPPKVKVAVVTGKKAIKLSSSSSLILKGGESLPMGREITVSIDQSSPVPYKTVLWCAKTFCEETIGKWIEKLKDFDLQTYVWKVGLNPVGGYWQSREYRLLVEVGEDSHHKDSLLNSIKRVFLTSEPVELQWPSSKPEYSINVHDANGNESVLSHEFTLNSEESIKIIQAPIGEGFHWQTNEDLEFNSSVWLDVGLDGDLCCGVEIDIEEYLTSVNSSEMPADSPQEFLKAQVVAARSWLLANWGSHHPGESYTVCNGDHCQCYYGLARVKSSSRRAVLETAGEALMYGDRTCDARYSKSCGGVTEPAENVWPFAGEPYLGHFRDLPGASPLDLTNEKEFEIFYKTSDSATACCAPGFAELGGRLTEFADYFRWTEIISGIELGQIIEEKTGEDLGQITAIKPLKRGPSGRLISVEVIGEKSRLVLTPELEIRRVLCKTHLPSSAFLVKKTGDDSFEFSGQGWGHGVGMCQIGAASLAANDYDYRSILRHYFPNTSIKKIY